MFSKQQIITAALTDATAAATAPINFQFVFTLPLSVEGQGHCTRNGYLRQIVAKHDQILPECAQQFSAILAGQRQMQADIEQIRKAVCGPNGDPHDVKIARLEGRWKIFGIVVTLLMLGCVIAGTVWALAKGT